MINKQKDAKKPMGGIIWGMAEIKDIYKLVKYVVEHASNGEEYTSSDLEAVRDSQSEGIGDYVIYVDHVNTLADDQLVLKGGGVCAHCHSDNVEASVPEMNEGYISRKLTCNVCNNATVEAYVFIGMEE